MRQNAFRAAAATAALVAAAVLPHAAAAQGTSAERALAVDSLAAATAPAAAAAPRAARGRVDRNLITREEIEASTQTDALGMVRNLRPAWFRSRGNGGFSTVEVLRVYVDGLRTDLSALRQLPPSVVREMRFLDASQATERFGTGHGMGALLVSTR